MTAVLSDSEIKRRLKKDLIIHPILDEQVQITCSKVDLHLSGIFYEIQRSSVDSYDPISTPEGQDFRREIILPLGESLVLHPGDLILAPTFENISMPRDLLGILQGRSSLGRLGIIVHATASFIDPEFMGTLTLELSNLGHLPVRLYTLAKVASLAFLRIDGKVERAYRDPVPSPFAAAKDERLDHYASPISEPSKHHQDWEYQMIRKVREELLQFPQANDPNTTRGIITSNLRDAGIKVQKFGILNNNFTVTTDKKVPEEIMSSIRKSVENRGYTIEFLTE